MVIVMGIGFLFLISKRTVTRWSKEKTVKKVSMPRELKIGLSIAMIITMIYLMMGKNLSNLVPSMIMTRPKKALGQFRHEII